MFPLSQEDLCSFQKLDGRIKRVRYIQQPFHSAILYDCVTELRWTLKDGSWGQMASFYSGSHPFCDRAVSLQTRSWSLQAWDHGLMLPRATSYMDINGRR